MVEEFSKVQLKTTVLDYQERFEELRLEVMLRVLELPESYYVSSFLSGLPKELRSIVKIHKPSKLSEVFEIARLQEHAFKAYFKKYENAYKTSW